MRVHPSHRLAPAHECFPTRAVHSSHLKSLCGHTVITQTPQFTSVHSRWLHPMSLYNSTMTCIYIYSTTQSTFTVPKTFCVLPVHLSLSSSLAEPLTIINLFTVSTVFPFPECHIACSLFRLASFAWYALMSPLCLFMT